MRRLIREAAGAIVLGAVLLLGAIVLPAPPAGAQAGTCLPYFNGADITGNESHAAHKIDGTRDLDLAIKSFDAVGIVTIDDILEPIVGRANVVFERGEHQGVPIL